MSVDLSEVELGLVVSLGTLREVLRSLNVNGRRWWIASDPQDAVEDGFISIAHGTRKCFDPLNTLRFRIPVIGNDDPRTRMDGIVLMIEPSTAEAEEPGFHFNGGEIQEDPVEDFHNFYAPVERALIARLQTRS
jgi:hypothetical protein